jgi:hypothetical protein
MSWMTKYTLAVLPTILLFTIWQLGIYSFEYFQCEGSLKNIVQCSDWGTDLMAWLVASMFWSPILLILSLPISAFFLIDTGAKHIGSKRAGL